MEVVVYKIKARREPEFLELSGWIRKEMSALPGFVSAETLRSVDEVDTYTDVWIWESIDLARSAHEKFASLRHAKKFMNVVEHVIHSSHYAPFL